MFEGGKSEEEKEYDASFYYQNKYNGTISFQTKDIQIGQDEQVRFVQHEHSPNKQLEYKVNSGRVEVNKPLDIHNENRLNCTAKQQDERVDEDIFARDKGEYGFGNNFYDQLHIGYKHEHNPNKQLEYKINSGRVEVNKLLDIHNENRINCTAQQQDERVDEDIFASDKGEYGFANNFYDQLHIGYKHEHNPNKQLEYKVNSGRVEENKLLDIHSENRINCTAQQQDERVDEDIFSSDKREYEFANNFYDQLHLEYKHSLQQIQQEKVDEQTEKPHLKDSDDKQQCVLEDNALPILDTNEKNTHVQEEVIQSYHELDEKLNPEPIDQTIKIPVISEDTTKINKFPSRVIHKSKQLKDQKTQAMKKILSHEQLIEHLKKFLLIDIENEYPTILGKQPTILRKQQPVLGKKEGKHLVEFQDKQIRKYKGITNGINSKEKLAMGNRNYPLKIGKLQILNRKLGEIAEEKRVINLLDLAEKPNCLNGVYGFLSEMDYLRMRQVHRGLWRSISKYFHSKKVAPLELERQLGCLKSASLLDKSYYTSRVMSLSQDVSQNVSHLEYVLHFQKMEKIPIDSVSDCISVNECKLLKLFFILLKSKATIINSMEVLQQSASKVHDDILFQETVVEPGHPPSMQFYQEIPRMIHFLCQNDKLIVPLLIEHHMFQLNEVILKAINYVLPSKKTLSWKVSKAIHAFLELQLVYNTLLVSHSYIYCQIYQTQEELFHIKRKLQITSYLLLKSV